MRMGYHIMQILFFRNVPNSCRQIMKFSLLKQMVKGLVMYLNQTSVSAVELETCIKIKKNEPSTTDNMQQIQCTVTFFGNQL